MSIVKTTGIWGKVTTVLVALSVCSVSIALAASEGGHADSGVLLKDFLYRLLNFALLFVLLAYFVTKPIRNGLAARKDGIAKQIEEAKAIREESEARYAEYDRKLTEAESEIEGISNAIRQEGELEKEKIISSARETAKKIEADAKKTADIEIARARTELRQDAVAMAIEIAEGLLKEKVTTEDKNRLVDEYMQKVGDLH